MYANAPKKMLLPALIDILSKYTDVRHTLSQKQLIEILEKEYYMKVDRKTLGRNLRDLMEYDSRVHGKTEMQRSVINKETGEPEESSMMTDFYMDKLFDDTELQVLVYNVIFSKHISKKEKISLVKRLESLGTQDFHVTMSNSVILPPGAKSDYNHLFLNLELLNEAVANHKKVSFRQKRFDPEKAAFVPGKEIIFTPFAIAEKYDEYYVLGVRDSIVHFRGHDLERFRLDMLHDMSLLEENGTELQEVDGVEAGFDFSAFLSSSPSLLPGERIRAKLCICGLRQLSDAVDYFGQENIIKIEDISQPDPEEPCKPIPAICRNYYVTVNCNDYSLRSWALNPYNFTYVIEPTEARKAIGDILEARAGGYKLDPKLKPHEWPDDTEGKDRAEE